MTNNIFVNYRRDDSGGICIAIYKELVKHFKQENIFKDFNTIKPGSDFVVSINNALNKCNLLLVVIGRQWLTVKNEQGKSRIDDPYDFVRIEIATALKRNINILPVLVDGMRMPSENELPDDIKGLVRRQSLVIHNESFDQDIFALVNSINDILGIKNQQAKMAYNISTGKVNPGEIVKPESNMALSIVCIVIGLIIVATNQEENDTAVMAVGLLMCIVGAYALYKANIVKKTWLSGDFENARKHSKAVKLISIIGIIGGIVLAIVVTIFTGLSQVATMLEQQN